MKMEDFIKKYAVNRKNTNSLKWDALDVRFGDPDLTAMWVADMEFKTPEAVREALVNRVEHGVFGYTYAWDSYFEAFFNWQKSRYNIDLKKEWISFSTGVVISIYWLVNAFTKVNDSVLILTPVYYPFHNAVKDNNRKLVKCHLKNTNGEYTIDYKKLEEDIVKNDAKLVIFCNPHNPAGRVWKKEELEKAFSIFRKHNLYIISDEIHQDINLGINPFVSALTLDNKNDFIDKLIVLTSASKTFNLACLLNSHIIIPDDNLRKIYSNYIKTVNQTEINILGMIATEAAYRNGSDWLDGLLKVIKYNYEYLKEELNSKIPEIILTPLEGTYLSFLDLKNVVSEDRVKEFIQDDCRLAIDFGEWFGEQCKSFVRINLATEHKYVEFAVKNMIKNLKNKKYK
ncbi:MalY/PatB family protein [Brachyspira pilosicoli]|uniref:MalY/PatB family protein n=1 Tax=Brachyspira pilosicoli TaxID=52584 RepID=UPI003007CBBB